MWDKYAASSSILILEYDLIRQKFKVIKRVEVPRSEYSYDTAVNMIVELNEQYNPAWIYCDSGAGEQKHLMKYKCFKWKRRLASTSIEEAR